MGYKNIAEKNIREGLTLMPYNKVYYKIMSQFPLKDFQKMRLQSVIGNLEPETVNFYGHDLELTMPFGWSRVMGQQRYGKEVFAEYKGTPIRPKDFYTTPTILVVFLKKSDDLLEEAFRFLDKIIVRFKGATLGREVEKINNHPFKKYMITMDVKVPLQKIRAKTLVLEKNDIVYLITGYAPLETFKSYESDIQNAMESIRFTNSGNEWGVYKPPYKNFSVKMPATPFYFQVY
jgi:hypothetical protein